MSASFTGTNTLNTVDLRATLRYALRAQVVFFWDDKTGGRRQGGGITRDLSRKGAYIIGPECPQEGSCVELKVILPMITDDTRVLRMEAEAFIVRIERQNGSPRPAGFAVAYHHVNLFANQDNQ